MGSFYNYLSYKVPKNQQMVIKLNMIIYFQAFDKNPESNHNFRN